MPEVVEGDPGQPGLLQERREGPLRFYVGTGEVEQMFELTPTQYRAVRSQADQTN